MKAKIICIAAAVAAATAITAVAVAQNGSEELGEPEILSSVEPVDSTDNNGSADIEDSESETPESTVDSDNETSELNEEESVDAPESKPAYHEGDFSAVDPVDSRITYKLDTDEEGKLFSYHWNGDTEESLKLLGETERNDASLEYLKGFLGTDSLPVDERFKGNLKRELICGQFVCSVLEGAEAYSPVEGRVIDASDRYNGGWGRHVAVEFGDGKVFVIAHLDDIYVEVGDTVSAGQALGVCGHSGHVPVEDPPLMRLIPMIVED